MLTTLHLGPSPLIGSSLEVAPEIWTEILTLLDPPSILSMSQTCKYLRRLSMQRTLWVRAIRDMCLERGLFLPSYPVDDMDFAHLQRAAMGPYRCKNLIETYSSSICEDIGPDMEPVSEITTDLKTSSRSREHYLVPGGRFLITATGFSLSVWDLGAPGRAPLDSPLLVSTSSLPFGEENEELYTIVCTVCDRSLRIGVMRWSYQTSVYEIFPDDEAPTLRLLPGRIRPGHTPGHVYGWTANIWGDRLVLCTFDHTLILWDYITRRYMLWAIELTDAQWYDCNIKFFGDLLVGLFSDCLKVWLVPTPDRPCSELITYTALGPHGPIPCPADAILHFSVEDSTSGYRTKFNCPLNWHSRSGDPLTFDVFYMTPPPALNIGPSARYQLAVTFHDDASPTPISTSLQLIKKFNFVGQCGYWPHNHAGGFSRYNLGFSAPISVDVPFPRGATDRPPSPTTQSSDVQRLVFGIYTVVTPRSASRSSLPGHCEDDLIEEVPPQATVRLTPILSVENFNSLEDWSMCASSGRFVSLGFLDGTRRDMMFVRSYLD